MDFRSRLPSHSEFLRDECGKHGLFLVSKGSAIVAELLRLAEHIPEEFVSPGSSEFARIIFDFRYFKDQTEVEAGIAQSGELTQLDEAFAATHGELLEDFFSLFRSVLHYANEVNHYFHATRHDVFVAQTIDSVLLYPEGKQLFCEVVHLYGVMLLLLDERIGGATREHLIVSYIRYRGAGEQETADIAALCRATGFVHDKPLPEGYPAAYFARVPIDADVVQRLLERLRSEDLYDTVACFPAPQHRCSALALQAGLCYILLYFCPHILEREHLVMRELADKHFADNWVVHYYLGFTADLTLVWRSFPAAREAIARTVELTNVQHHEAHMRSDLESSHAALTQYLQEGNLSEEVVLDTFHTAVLPTLRNANVALRWFILHGTRGGAGNRYLASLEPQYAAVKAHVGEDTILQVLLATAQVEYATNDMFRRLLNEKSRRWHDVRTRAADNVERLSVFYGHDNILAGGQGGEQQLEQWFADVAERIANLDDRSDPQATRRKAQKLVKALESVREYHQIDGNLQVVQLIRDTCGLLCTLVRLVNVESSALVTLAHVSDFSYAWGRLSTFGFYVKGLQMRLRQDPSVAAQMRAVMLKLASVVALPCCRVDQASQTDARFIVVLKATADYYSTALVHFMRSLLQVIPVAIFEVLRKVMYELSDVLVPCPSRLSRDEVLTYSQLDVRARLSTFTAEIARYAGGLLAMKNTIMGTIEVHSHALLEDGIRRELVEQITRELHAGIRFDRHATPPSSSSLLEKDLQRLQQRLEGIRISFEYIQDFLNLHGLRVWLEEYARIVGFTFQMECNVFQTRKLYPWSSPFQNARAPIPFFTEVSPKKSAYSFLGHLSQHLLFLTAPQAALFVAPQNGWFSRRTGEETVGPRTFSGIQQAIGCHGLAALDRLLVAITAKDLRLVVKHIHRTVEPYRQLFARISDRLAPVSQTPTTATDDYAELTALLQRDLGAVEVVLVRIGRLQHLRNMISHELRINSKVRSGALSAALDTANHALLTRLYAGDLPAHDATRVAAMQTLLHGVGMTDPYNTICVDTSVDKALTELPLFLLVLVMAVVPRLRFHDGLATYAPAASSDSVDPHCLMGGIALLLRQYPSTWMDLFVQHMCQAIRVSMDTYSAMDRQRQMVEVLPTFAETMGCLLDTVEDRLNVPTASRHHPVPPMLFCEFRIGA